MLSAVAARKARLEGKQVPTLQTAPPTTPKVSTHEPANPTPPSSKRKPSGTPNKPANKKRVKQQKQDEQRYFRQDAFKEQHDVIVVDDDSDDSDGMPFDDDLMAASGVLSSPNAGAMSAKAPRRRAWSPSEPLCDSSDEEDEGELEEGEEVIPGTRPPAAVAGPSRVAPKVLSTFHPVLDQNMFFLTPNDARTYSEDDSPGTIIILRPSDTLALLGTYRLIVLQGAISIMGSILTPSRTCHRIFAPRSSPIPVLKSTTDHEDCEPLQIPEFVRSVVGHDATVILVQDLQSDVERLGLVCRIFEGVFSPSRAQSKIPSVDINLGGVYLLHIETSEMSPFVMPPSWEDTVASVMKGMSDPQDASHSRRVYLVKGPRNTGKSTFARVLLNTLLTRYRRVAFLECDLGQSEFTPAGMVALTVVDKPLFGPAFTHPSLPYAAHFVGAASPKSCPSYYIECIHALVQSYNLDIQHGGLLSDNSENGADKRFTDVVPLIVNTMGWTRGLGSDLSLKIEETVEPSEVFELQGPQMDDAYSAYPPFDGTASHAPGVSDRVRQVAAVAPPAAASFFGAADHRTLSVLSYFHATFPQFVPSISSDVPEASPSELAFSRIAQTWNVSLPLCAQLPYEIDGKAAFDHIVLVGAGMEDVVTSELPRVLNGAIVGLVHCEPGAMDDFPDNPDLPSHRLPYSQGSSPPSPFSSSCCGLALVRSVSYTEEGLRIHLLTRVPSERLFGARIMVKGELELPIWGMLDYRSAQGDIAGVERDKVPFLRWGKSEGAGAERRRVRRNLMRRGQM